MANGRGGESAYISWWVVGPFEGENGIIKNIRRGLNHCASRRDSEATVKVELEEERRAWRSWGSLRLR